MRHVGLLIASLFVALSCARGSSSRSGKSASEAERFREDLHCTERPAGGEDACRAKGCRFGPALSCHGNEPSEQELEDERRVYEDGTISCDCICPDDEKWCSEVQ